MTIVYVATVNTGHFDFMALGVSDDDARTRLLEAWAAHAQQTGATPGLIDRDEINVSSGAIGQVFRDGSPFPAIITEQTYTTLGSRVLTIFGLTAEDRRDLRELVGLGESERRLPRGYDRDGNLAGVKLDEQYGYDIDEVIEWARRRDLAYTLTAEVVTEYQPC